MKSIMYKIDYIFQVLVCEVDNQEYTVQTISFTNSINIFFIFLATDLKRAAVNLRKVFRNLVMPVNELRVESTTDGFQKLQIIVIITSISYRLKSLCQFKILRTWKKCVNLHSYSLKVKYKFGTVIFISILDDDVIRYLDGSIHINPMALIRTQQQFMPLHKLLINLFSDQNIPLDFRILIQIVKLYEDRDLEALLAYRPQDQELFIF